MHFTIVCNEAPGGWLPGDLAKGFGGSEESIVLFAQALAAAGHKVAVFHDRPPNAEPMEQHLGVQYVRRDAFRPELEYDVLISYREPKVWRIAQLGKVRCAIHWSVDTEPPWPPQALARLDAYVCLTHWAAARQVWVPNRLMHVIPYGIDLATLTMARPPQPVPAAERELIALYCASFDRGLERLLEDWPKIREARPDARLRVAYGWGLFDRFTRGNRQAAAFKAKIEAGLAQEGIEYLGELSRADIAREYWRARWWVHPLNRPDSELFCLNAVKARIAGAMPVVLPLGALAETAQPFIPYETWVGGADAEALTESGQPCPPTLDWKAVVADYWLPLADNAAGKEAT